MFTSMYRGWMLWWCVCKLRHEMQPVPTVFDRWDGEDGFGGVLSFHPLSPHLIYSL